MKAIIVGIGFISETHVNGIRSAGGEVSWIVGRDIQRTSAFASANSIPNWTTNLGDALASDAEIVHICTPPHTHGEIIRACLKAGKHIICEKPLAIDTAEAKALAEEAEDAYMKSGLVTALCCNVRYYPANLKIAKEIRASENGSAQSNQSVKVFNGSYLQEFHIPPHPDGWRFDDELSGGMRALTEIGTHWIDLAYAWTGLKITEVSAALGNWFPLRYLKDGMLTEDASGEVREVESEDTAAVLMKFENGAIGTLLLSETAPGHPNDLSIEVTDLKNSYKWEEANETDRDATFAALFGEVYASIEGGRHGAYPNFHDGAYIAAVCSAIKHSADSGRWTKVE